MDANDKRLAAGAIGALAVCCTVQLIILAGGLGALSGVALTAAALSTPSGLRQGTQRRPLAKRAPADEQSLPYDRAGHRTCHPDRAHRLQRLERDPPARDVRRRHQDRARTTIDRKTVRIPDGKPAVVFFFSATCGSCLAAGKAVVKVHRQATDKADFLLVDLDPTEPRTAIETFRARIGDKSLPMVSKGAAELAQAWQVTALSTVVVVDAAGTVTYRVTDAPAADILAAIDEATKQ